MACIWVDADSTPKAVREIIIKAVIRTETLCYFVANHSLPIPASPFIKKIQVEPGFDVADNLIAQRCNAEDLVITQDIPLAAEVMEKKTNVINNRGEYYDPETIRQKLIMRDFFDTLRSSGIQSGGAAAFSDRDKMMFANSLDKWLARNAKKQS